ncbi:hypothetical protein EON81_23450 [bacterium]|nr:MAG: hypothetical protein EON81_23450 [bacterium]
MGMCIHRVPGACEECRAWHREFVKDLFGTPESPGKRELVDSDTRISVPGMRYLAERNGSSQEDIS